MDFLLPAVQGPPVRLSDLRGQPVIVTFWAFWCWTWEEVHLAYVALAQEEGARLVTVSVDCQRLEQLGRVDDGPYVRLKDPGSEVSTAWGIRVVPTVLVLDAEGNVRHRFEGYPGNQELRRCLRSLRPLPPAPEPPPAVDPGAGPVRLSLPLTLLADEAVPAGAAARILARASAQLRTAFGVELRASRTGSWRFPKGARDPRLVLARHVPQGAGPVLVLSGQRGVDGSGAAAWPRALVIVGPSEDEAVAMVCHEVSHWFGARDLADERLPEPSVMNYRDRQRGMVDGRVVWDSGNRRRIQAALESWPPR